MRILHAYNSHRGFGGSDKATAATIEALRHGGMDVEEFVRDSRALPAGLRGKLTAFVGGFYASEAVHAFRDALEARRPDVVHVHELYPLVSPWILPECTRRGIPVVMSCYDYRLSCPIATHQVRGEACHRCLGGREYWCVLRNCRANVPESIAYAARNASARAFGLYTGHVSRFMAISEYQRDFLAERAGVPAGRIDVNAPVVPMPPEPVADPAAGSYVGYAGRFVPEKGVEVFVEACRRAGLPMAFAGDAPHHPAVRPEDGARFVMTRSSAELADFYRGARIIVVPSLWPETFGLVAGEAMAHGVPVVASRIGALTTTLGEDGAGVLVSPGDVEGLAQALRRIWDDAAFARRLGAAARERVASRFSEAAHFGRLMAIYRALPGSSTRSTGASA